MLKSPSSILNSIKKMKSNLRNDKEQLRIIKNNFVYLQTPYQHTQSIMPHVKQSSQDKNYSRHGLQEENIKNIEGSNNKQEQLGQIEEDQHQYRNSIKKIRSNSLLNINYLKQKTIMNRSKLIQNKQNINLQSNHNSRITQRSHKTKTNNKLYIDDQADNILKNLNNNFRKNSVTKLNTKHNQKYKDIQNKLNTKHNQKYKDIQKHNSHIKDNQTINITEERTIKESKQPNSFGNNNNNNDETQREKSNIKNMRNRYQMEIQHLKSSHLNQKTNIIEQFKAQLQQQSREYERQILEMKEYILMLEEQMQRMDHQEDQQQRIIQEGQSQNKDRVMKVDASMQMSVLGDYTNSKQCIDRSMQTEPILLVDYNSIPSSNSHLNASHLPSSISPNYQSSQSYRVQNGCNVNGFSINLQTESQIREQTSQIREQTCPNQPISKVNNININHNQLIQELCQQFQAEHLFNHSQSQSIKLNTLERQRYQHIINRLLEENTKMQHKIQKMFTSAHADNPKEKTSFFKNHNINYKTVSSHQPQDSNEQSSNQQSKVINRFFTSQYNASKDKHLLHSHQNQSVSQFTSRVNESQVQSSNIQSSIQNRSKGSIIYRISNVLSVERSKKSKGSSRSKIPMKNPPVQLKSKEGNGFRQHHMRMKTEVCERPRYDEEGINCQANYELGCSYKQRKHSNYIDLMGERAIKEKEFKFYDNESARSNRQEMSINSSQHRKNRMSHNWEDESESEILNDQMKLKTIKTFKCFSKQ